MHTLSPVFGHISFRLNDVPLHWFQAVSFFFWSTLLLAFVLKVLWNLTSRDLPVLQKIRYWHALAMIVACAVVLVATDMALNGPKEWIAPESRHLGNETQESPEDLRIRSESSRRERMHDLKASLWALADVADGRFPADLTNSGISERFWKLPPPLDFDYVYRGGARGKLKSVVLYEPEVYAGD